MRRLSFCYEYILLTHEHILDMHSNDLFIYIVCINIPILCMNKAFESKMSRVLNNTLADEKYEE